MLKVICFAVSFFVLAETLEYSRVGQGYHRGILPDCPGSTKPAEITPNSLRNLKISVFGSRASLTTYSYYHVKRIARHPEIDFNKKTIIYVPGYLDLSAVPIRRSLVQLYQDLGYNVLILDYEAFDSGEMPVAARLMPPVGKHVAEMLSNLTTLGLDPKKLELVGLSLGGQAISFIAKNYREITGRNISSLTALDPAGRCFRHLGPHQRLDPSDADFVLSIATNMDEMGIATPVGHVTFYVNGGEFQPADLWWLPCDTLCSHVKSYILWLSALINPGKFVGLQCDSIQQARDFNCFDRKPLVTNTMDLYTDRSKPGIYYLSTLHKYPYYLGKEGVYRSSEPVLKQLSYLNVADKLLV
ncbi:lipase member H-B-like [Cydia strobilella]|uniref:lipase member H-B-like n=1 Tax=Cydia strobilella TaxID=1100964 RepID=UPI003003E475